jgi:hypothetical protein
MTLNEKVLEKLALAQKTGGHVLVCVAWIDTKNNSSLEVWRITQNFPTGDFDGVVQKLDEQLTEERISVETRKP